MLLVGEKEQRGNLTNPSCPKMTQWQVMSNGQPFSTFEKDRDQNKETNCAQMRNRGSVFLPFIEHLVSEKNLAEIIDSYERVK